MSGAFATHTPPWPIAMPEGMFRPSMTVVNLVVFAVALGALEDLDAIPAAAGAAPRILDALGDPDAALLVEGHRDGVDEARLRGDQFDVEARRHLHLLDRVLRRERRTGWLALAVRDDLLLALSGSGCRQGEAQGRGEQRTEAHRQNPLGGRAIWFPDCIMGNIGHNGEPSGVSRRVPARVTRRLTPLGSPDLMRQSHESHRPAKRLRHRFASRGRSPRSKARPRPGPAADARVVAQLSRSDAGQGAVQPQTQAADRAAVRRRRRGGGGRRRRDARQGRRSRGRLLHAGLDRGRIDRCQGAHRRSAADTPGCSPSRSC